MKKLLLLLAAACLIMASANADQIGIGWKANEFPGDPTACLFNSAGGYTITPMTDGLADPNANPTSGVFGKGDGVEWTLTCENTNESTADGVRVWANTLGGDIGNGIVRTDSGVIGDTSDDEGSKFTMSAAVAPGFVLVDVSITQWLTANSYALGETCEISDGTATPPVTFVSDGTEPDFTYGPGELLETLTPLSISNIGGTGDGSWQLIMTARDGFNGVDTITSIINVARHIILDYTLAPRGAAYDPVPGDGDTGLDVTTSPVSWTGPSLAADPNLVSVDGYEVYVSVGVEPNDLTDTPTFTTETSLALTTPLDYGTTYYWRVDTQVTWDSNSVTGNVTDLIEGDVWQFTTIGAAPVISDYDNVVSALSLPPASLSATVSDGNLDLSSVVFTVLEDDYEYPAGASYTLTPDVSDLYNPTVTLDTDTAGVYKIKLTATDGEAQTDEAIAEVTVFENACDAQKDALTTAWVQNYYDVDEDCDVDLDDLAALALVWLAESSLQAQETYTGDVLYAPGLVNDAVLGQMVIPTQTDGQENNMVIDTAAMYTNDTGSPVTLQIDEFAFVSRLNLLEGEPITPFVVSWIPDPNIVDPNANPAQFTVEAIGTTRLAVTDFPLLAYNVFPFSDSTTQITVQPGEIIAGGFVDNDGSGGGKVSTNVVRRIEGLEGTRVWRASDGDILNTSSIAVGQPPIVNVNTSPAWETRVYAYEIGCSIAP